MVDGSSQPIRPPPSPQASVAKSFRCILPPLIVLLWRRVLGIQMSPEF